MGSSNLKTRIKHLEQRQPQSDAVNTIVITDMEDKGNKPRLVWRVGRSGFEEVPEGTAWEDL
jgi:hypothetical protein